MDQNSNRNENLTPKKKPCMSPGDRFKAIHQRDYENMEDIQTAQTRKEEECKNLMKNWTPLINKLSQPKSVSERGSKSCVAIRTQSERKCASKFATPLKNGRKKSFVLSLNTNQLGNKTPKTLHTNRQLNSPQNIPIAKPDAQPKTPSQLNFATPLKGSSKREFLIVANETPKKTRRDAQKWTPLPKSTLQIETRDQPKTPQPSQSRLP